MSKTFFTEPYFCNNCLAFFSSSCSSSIIILIPRSTSFWLLSCILTIRFPFTLPSFIITEVLIMLRIIFCPVPLFMRELPVTNSGPTIISMGISTACERGESGLLLIPAVSMPLFRACCNARRQEIGIMRSMGASENAVRNQFLAEAFYW